MGLLKPWTIAEHSLFSIIPQTFIAQRRALQWWENEPRERKISSIAGTSRSNHSIDRWRTFRPGFRRTSIATSQHLTELLIWNKLIKLIWAKDVSHFARSIHCCKLREVPKQTTSSLDLSCRELSRELFIREFVSLVSRTRINQVTFASSVARSQSKPRIIFFPINGPIKWCQRN